LRVDSAIESGSVVSPHYDSMVAKVIAHGATRAEAARKLKVALERATIVGPVTNRALLIDLMTRLCDIDAPGSADTPQVDTGWLDRQDLGDGPQPSPLHAAAAALAVVRGAASTHPFPAGWRNNPSQPHAQAIGDHIVEYAFDRAERLTHLAVDGSALPVDAHGVDALGRIDATVLGDTVFVAGGLFTFTVPPRFADPDDAGRAGSTIAPMPGKVVRMLVELGDTVAAGQALLTIEAMKMEHQVVSPSAGVVSEVYVSAGQQLDHGQPLVKVDPA
jgi:acetyl/propionyl-CoA carboxylase alpha subunit